jgi:hypothetical protein
MKTANYNGAVSLGGREPDLLDRDWRAANYLSVPTATSVSPPWSLLAQEVEGHARDRCGVSISRSCGYAWSTRWT